MPTPGQCPSTKLVFGHDVVTQFIPACHAFVLQKNSHNSFETRDKNALSPFLSPRCSCWTISPPTVPTAVGAVDGRAPLPARERAARAIIDAFTKNRVY